MTFDKYCAKCAPDFSLLKYECGHLFRRCCIQTVISMGILDCPECCDASSVMELYPVKCLGCITYQT